MSMLHRQSIYYKKMHEQGRPSLMAKIYGIYTVKVSGLRSMHLMVMKNSIVKVNGSNKLLHTFDLKGSKIKRRVLPLSINLAGSHSFRMLTQQQVLKDRDLMYLQQFRQSDLINISMEDRRKIVYAIRHDVDFLEREGLMDYSLLLAVEQRSGVEAPVKKPEELIQFTGE